MQVRQDVSKMFVLQKYEVKKELIGSQVQVGVTLIMVHKQTHVLDRSYVAWAGTCISRL